MRWNPGWTLTAALGGALVALPALAADPEQVEGEGSDSPAIYGGTVVNSCGWPTTVFLGGCTGTLVHPRMVVYAAHCGTNVNAVGFGEQQGNLSRTVPTEFCQANPAYNGVGQGTDQAFCVLSQSMDDIPIVPMLMGCETAVLTPGQEVTIVGFGQADAQPNFGIKREVTTTINSVGVEAFIGGAGKDSCQGDSGGPVYVRLPDGPHGGAWRVFGITSYGGQCGGGGYYSLMHNAAEWMAGAVEGMGIDFTPCHQADGTWDPGPECGFFPEDPQSGGGAWATGCGGGEVGGYASTCGTGFNAEPDNTAPTVAILSPDDGSTYTSDGINPVDVTLSAEADDGDGWGVASVELWINEELIATDTTAPYAWDLKLPSGGYVVDVIAVDRAENRSKPDRVHLGVDAEPPFPPEPDDSGDGGGGDDGDDGAASAGDGGTGAGDDAFGAEDTGDEGCACNAGGDAQGRAGLAWLLMAAAFGGFTRRRRLRST